MIIDVFNHILPQKFLEKMLLIAPNLKGMAKFSQTIPAMVNLEERFKIMDLFDGYTQILSMSNPPIEALGPPSIAREMAQLANECMAELVVRYPDRFPAFIAALPMNDPEGSLREAERAIKEQGAVGVQVFSNVLGQPLDKPETIPLFDLMANLDLPVWIHPARGADFPDYKTEPISHYEIWFVFGWPYETSVALAHLVFSGLFDRHPNIKIITHHFGGMIPYFEGRVGPAWDRLGSRTSDVDYSVLLKKLRKRPLEYFRNFYADTALFGARPATICGLKFFGPEKTLFGTDAPFGPEQGSAYIRCTIEIINSLDITPTQRQEIFEAMLADS